MSLEGSGNKSFTFDYVADEDTTQDTMFMKLGKDICESCLEGYNGTIFAYGQTGSGKTFTMQGPSATEMESAPPTARGLIPRMFEHLFALIARDEKRTGGARQYLCKASYLEIYNERIFDLMDPAPASAGLNLREDIKKGPFVEALMERVVATPDDALAVLEEGGMNRTVGATQMNRESSRSHSVFTLFIQSKEDVDGVCQIRKSQLNLVDLAGSERQKLTNAADARLKEASNINKSLSALGNVIMSLVDIQKGKTRHIAYRDSKLTFLLKDSLGGNTKTAIIANVSPANVSFGETLSTLKFAQRAKLITNRAVINEDMDGNVSALQDQIRSLKAELEAFKTSGASGMVPADFAFDLDNPDAVTPEQQLMHLQLIVSKHIQDKRKMLDDAKRFKQRLNALNLLISKQSLTIQATKLIIRLRDEALARAKDGGCSSSSPSSGLTPQEEDTIAALQEELDAVRKLADHNPKLTQIAIENLDLRDLVTQYQDKWGDDFSANQEALVALHQHIQGLDFQMNRLILEKEALTKRISDMDAAASGGESSANNPGLNSPLRPHNAGSGAAGVASPRVQANNLALEQWKASMAFEEKISGLQAQLDVASAELENVRSQAQEKEADLTSALQAEQTTVKELETSLASAATAHKLQISSLKAQLEDSPDADSLNELLSANAELTARVAELEASNRDLSKAAALAQSKSERLSLSLSRKVSIDADEVANLKSKISELEETSKAAAQRELEATTNATMYSERIEALQASLEEAKVSLAQAQEAEAEASATALQAESARDTAVRTAETLEAKVAEQKDALETMQEENAFVQDMLDSSQAVLAKSNGRVTELETELAAANALLEETRTQLASKDADAGAAIMAQLQEIQAERDSLSKANGSLRAQVDNYVAELEARDTEFESIITERDSAKGQVESLRDQIVQLRASVSAANSEVSQLKSHAEESRVTLEMFETTNDKLETQIENLKAAATEAEAEAAAVDAAHADQMAELMGEVKSLTLELKKVKGDAEQAEASAASLQQALQATVEEYAARAESAEESLAGAQKEVQSLEAKVTETEERASTAEASSMALTKRAVDAEERLAATKASMNAGADAAALANEQLMAVRQEHEGALDLLKAQLKSQQSLNEVISAELEGAKAEAEEAASLREAFVALQTQFEETRASKAETVAKLQARVDELEPLAEEMEDLKDDLADVEAARNALEDALAMAQDEGDMAIDAAEARASKAEAALGEALAGRAGDGKLIKDLKKNLKKAIADGERLFTDLRRLKDLEEESFRDAIESKAQIEALQADKVRMSKEIATAAEQIAELNEEVTKLSGHHNLKQKIQHHARVKEECNALKLELSSAHETIDDLKAAVAAYLAQLNAYRAEDGKEPLTEVAGLNLSFDPEQQALHDALVAKNAELSSQLDGMASMSEQMRELEREIKDKNFEIRLLQKAADFKVLKDDSIALIDSDDDDLMSEEGDENKDVSGLDASAISKTFGDDDVNTSDFVSFGSSITLDSNGSFAKVRSESPAFADFASKAAERSNA